jgi:hypothetical protein
LDLGNVLCLNNQAGASNLQSAHSKRQLISLEPICQDEFIFPISFYTGAVSTPELARVTAMQCEFVSSALLLFITARKSFE